MKYLYLVASMFLLIHTQSFAKSSSVIKAGQKFGSFDNFMGSWDCQGTRTDSEKGVVKDSKFIKDVMTFAPVLKDSWVVADYEDTEGYVNRCYYTQQKSQKMFDQVCVSSHEGVTLGHAIAESPTKIRFSGETEVRGRKYVHKKTIQRVALGALDFVASLEDEVSGFKREWKAYCFFRKGELVQ